MSARFLDLGPGLHEGVPEAQYHERVLGVVSNGAMGYLLRAPSVYKAWIDGKLKSETSPALAFGTAFHCAALEPERFRETYVVQPDFGYLLKHDASGTTKEQGAANKARKAEWEAVNAGKRMLDPEDGAHIEGMLASLLTDRVVGPYFRPLHQTPRLAMRLRVEVTIVWTDPATGLVCRVRPDLMIEQGQDTGVLDIKTTGDASHAGFNRSRANYGYHRGEAFYREGCAAVGKPLALRFDAGIDGYGFVAIEKEPPYLVKLHGCSPDALDLGRRLCTEAKSTLARCLELDDWPGLPGEPSILTLYPWETR